MSYARRRLWFGFGLVYENMISLLLHLRLGRAYHRTTSDRLLALILSIIEIGAGRTPALCG